ncbi:MAG: DUF378 domain-containing protein [Pseudochelatococcus sp.]|jgi:uncharacterized membrane protein YuzA (DUF378 family)|uniref:DUF378 domain-containing protein n=1 Tax=Pseudochelatococcus sp. TaxID=2020869 RepID=UPI003D8DEB66
MHALNVVTLLLVILGGLNWMFVGLLQIDLGAAIFGGQDAQPARIAYVLVGFSAAWQLFQFFSSLTDDDIVNPRR